MKEVFVRDAKMAAARLETICKNEAPKPGQAGQDRDIDMLIAEIPKFTESLRKISEELKADIKSN